MLMARMVADSLCVISSAGSISNLITPILAVEKGKGKELVVRGGEGGGREGKEGTNSHWIPSG